MKTGFHLWRNVITIRNRRGWQVLLIGGLLLTMCLVAAPKVNAACTSTADAEGGEHFWYTAPAGGCAGFQGSTSSDGAAIVTVNFQGARPPLANITCHSTVKGVDIDGACKGNRCDCWINDPPPGAQVWMSWRW